MNLKTTNFEINGETKDYLNKKIEHLGKFVNLNSPNTNLDVEIGKISEHHQKGDIFRAEFNLSIGGEYYRADEESQSIMSAIDLAIEELLKQLRRGKDKRETMIKRGGRKIKEMLRNINPMK